MAPSRAAAPSPGGGCSLLPSSPPAQQTRPVLSTECLPLTAPLAFLILEMGNATTATCYFPPDVPAATTSTVLRSRVSLKAALESSQRKAQQGASVSLPGKSHTRTSSKWDHLRCLAGYGPLVAQADSQLRAPITIPSLLYLPYKRRTAKCQDFSHLCAKFHKKLTRWKFFFNFQHKTISDKHNLCLHERPSAAAMGDKVHAVIPDNIRRIWNSCNSTVHRGNIKEAVKAL